jgi:hypothetical protein
MKDETADVRAACVRRRFKRARLDAMGRGFWEHWRTESCAFLVGMYSMVLILLLEPALGSDRWPAGMIDVRIPGSLAAGLLLVLPLNGWIFGLFLSNKTPGETALPRWLLALRWLASSLPLLGLYTLSLWRAALEQTSIQQASRAPSLDLSTKRLSLPRGIRSRGLYRSGFFFVWAAGSLLPLLVWAVWLVQTTALGRYRQPAIVGACIILHLISSLSMAKYFRSELKSPFLDRWRRSLLAIASVLWLLAIPGMVVGLALFLLADPPRKSLTWLTYANRSGARRAFLWRALQGRLRQRWETRPWYAQWKRPAGLSPAEGTGYADAQVTAFYRLKTLFLTLESAALFAVVPARTRQAALPSALWTAAVLAGAGLTLQAATLAARFLRIPRAQRLGRHPYGRYLLLTQAAFLAGLYMAALWAAGQVQQLGLLLCLGGALCGMLVVLFLLLPTAATPNGPDMTLWALLFLFLAAWGGLITLDGTADQPSLATLKALAALTPLWSCGLFLACEGWLLRPFSWRQVFDRTLPRRVRSLLAFTALTAALPLGGLMVPFWIFARHRLRPRQ